MEDLKYCDPLNVYINNSTLKPECIPGTLIPPQGYSQVIPEVLVKPKPNWIKYALLGVAAYVLLKK